MGPKQSSQIRSKQEQFFTNYEIIQQLPNEHIRFLQHKHTKKEYLFRELSFNDKREYTKKLQTIKIKQEQLKNADHIVPISQYFSKEEVQYCSTFYKIYVLFQYPQRTLDDEINQRNLRKNSFSETELWSILASCILGLSHLQKKDIRHGCLKSTMIFLSQQGHIKISDPFTTECQTNYQTLLNRRTTRHLYLSPEQCEALQSQLISPTNLNPYKSDIFTLGMILLECGLLQYQDECYRDQYSRIHWETLEYNKNRFRRNYSEELANMLDYMLGPESSNRPEWIQLQNYVITDSMGKSLISQGRRSVIVGCSKPVSVNVNTKPSSNLTGGKFPDYNKPGLENNKVSSIDAPGIDGIYNKTIFPSKNVTTQKFPEQKSQSSNLKIVSNKGIGISGSKPGSIQKFYNPVQQTFQSTATQVRRPQFTSEYRPLTDQGISQAFSNNKPKSVVHNNSQAESSSYGHFIGTNKVSTPSNFQPFVPISANLPSNFQNFPSSISNLPNFSKPYINQSPIRNQILSKNTEINPVKVSIISNTRPYRSIFPNVQYITKTKVDENLVQVDDDEQQSSRTMSQQSKSNMNYMNQQNANVAYKNSNSRKNYVSQYEKEVNNNQHIIGHPFNIDQKSYQPHQNVQRQFNQQFSGDYQTNTKQNFDFNIGNQHNNASLQNQNNGQFLINNNTDSRENKPFEGQFVIQTFKLGSRYEGYKLNGLRNGPGKFFYQDGGMYDGNWHQNKMQGYGKLYYQSGKIAYDGEWVQDQFTGYGILYNQNPDPLNQPFDYSNFDNVEELWTKYEGQFSQDCKNGKGVLYLSNGQYFEGNFMNDTAQGEGAYTTLNGRSIRGIWQNNLLVKQLQ